MNSFLPSLSSTLQQLQGVNSKIEVVAPNESQDRLSTALRQDFGKVPSELRIHYARTEEIQNRCIELVVEAERQEATILMSGNVLTMLDGTVAEISAWVARHPKIGFASPVVVDQNDLVVEAGSITDGNGGWIPLFAGDRLHSWGVFGGPLWYRNVQVASPYIVAFKSAPAAKAALHLRKPDGKLQGLSQMLSHVLIQNNFRGVSIPTARAQLALGGLLPKCKFTPDFRKDAFSHPEFSSVAPVLLRI
jgi:O-antigen biosynthesis protein